MLLRRNIRLKALRPHRASHFIQYAISMKRTYAQPCNHGSVRDINYDEVDPRTTTSVK